MSGYGVEIGMEPGDLELARALMEVSGDDDFDDDVGDVEIGADGEVYVGASRGRRVRLPPRAARAAIQRGMMAVRSANGGGGGGAARPAGRPAVQQRQAGDVYSRILPFTRDADVLGLVQAGAELDVVSEPQMPFRPDVLLIPEEVGRDFAITDIKIGTETLFAAAGRVLGTAFRPDAPLQKMFTRTGQTSQQFTIRVRNISLDARAFYAQMLGWGAQ